MYILGLSAFYHDSAAALLKDGVVIAAAEEERFSRKKHDGSFPSRAIRYCLKEAGIELADVSAVAFHEKPVLALSRMMETYLTLAPKGLRSFVTTLPLRIQRTLLIESLLKRELRTISGLSAKKFPKLLFPEHHESHAASSFFTSPFKSAAILCLDGVGEWATTSVWRGLENRLEPKWELRFPHSLGFVYSAFTSYTGFKVNSGEYKLMGLANYGQPKYVDLIYDHLIDLKKDGSFRVNQEYFSYATDLRLTNERFHSLFGRSPREQDQPLSQKDMDMACSIQRVTEEVILRLARTAHGELGEEALCLAGGVALNGVATGRLLREGPFKEIWIQPASGDDGGALGATLAAWHGFYKKDRDFSQKSPQSNCYLGPKTSEAEMRKFLDGEGARYERLEDTDLFDKVAHLIEQGQVVGWVQGRMEFGPRALGNRSILGDPRNPRMQEIMNSKIKRRESFRPFAPAVLSEKASDYFEIDRPSPFMLFVVPVKDQAKHPIPAVTHIDQTARLQTVHAETNPPFHSLIRAFEKLTGCPLVLNTSFNVRGEPIVCTGEDAYRCFMRTEIDCLVVGNLLLVKNQQSSAKAQGGNDDSLPQD